MQQGIPVLTKKGQQALKNAPPDLSPVCRNILVQTDGKKTVEDIQKLFRGLKGLDEGMERLFSGGYLEISHQCIDLVKSLVQQMLGPKAPTLLKKIDEMHAKYGGDACWDHIDELNKTARMFYGEVLAESLRVEISRLVQQSRKQS
jgi:hypothetical protein